MNDKIMEYVPDFLEGSFKSYVDNVFIQIRTAEMMRELEKIRHFVSDDIYQRLLSEQEVLERQGLIQMYDELNVKQTNIMNSEVIEDKILIKVSLVSRYLDYLIDTDGNFVRGNNQVRKEKYNYLTFERKLNAKEAAENRKCKKCGASMDVNANGKCAYCGSTYDLTDTGWLLVSFEVA